MEIYGMSGEKLGTIGEPDRPAQEEEGVPEWKKTFLSTPSVSVRKGIASNYDLPYEDTSTLVLTALSTKFVDIRFPLKYSSSSTESIVSHPQFWAFCGTVKTTFLEPSGQGSNGSPGAVTMPYSAHAVFVHGLDSKGSGIVDEGDMFLLPNGDTMEVGIWTNPTTGKYEMYKEYWTQPSPRPSMPGSRSHQELQPELKKSPCIVAEVTHVETDTDTDTHGQGTIIRIGDFVQGIYKSGDTKSALMVGRWEYYGTPSLPAGTPEARDMHAGWSDDPRNTGSEDCFPLHLLFDHSGEVKVGDTAQTSSGQFWRILEVVR